MMASFHAGPSFYQGQCCLGGHTAGVGEPGHTKSALQTDLTQIPTLTITPESLPVVVLYEGSFSAVANQTLMIGNDAQSNVNYTVSSLPSSLQH